MAEERNQPKRDEILMAAARVIKNKSVLNFTLEAVAKEAGISKGGLLYHFPNKNALMQGMVERPLEAFKKALDAFIRRDTSDSGKWSRAYATESMMMSDDMKLLWTSALTAVMALNPDLLKPLREMNRKWMELVQSDGIDPLDGVLILLIAEGLWYMDLFDFQGISEDLRKQILRRAVDLTR